MPDAAASSPLDESARDKDKDEMPTMGFLDHLEELRKRIIYSIVAIAVGFFACWGYAENIYGIMQRPIMDALQQNGLSAKLVFPAALVFLIGYGKAFQPMITLSEYSSLFLTIIVGLGAIFEMPILVFFLALMGIVSAGWMWRNLRYSILVIFIIAAIITPTTDILNMCIFAAPMIALYVLSIGIAWLVHPNQRKKRAEKNS